MEVKYGIIFIPNIPNLAEKGFRFDFDGYSSLAVEQASETLKEVIEPHWEKWMGSLAWEDLEKKSVQIRFFRKSSTLDVNDSENVEIRNVLLTFAKALLLSEYLISPRGSSYIVTGKAEIREGRLVPKTIQDFTKATEFVASDYMFLKEYQESKVFKKWFEQRPIYSESWFKNLGTIYAGINAVGDVQRYFPINIALYTYEQSLKEKFVDFSFPSLVRSLETLITLGPGQGRGLFVKRVNSIRRPSEDYMFDLDDDYIKKAIRNCYGLRSDAVHGKRFESSLGSKSAEFLNYEIHKHHYFLHATVRHVIRRFLSDENLKKASESREGLEKYWDSTIPEGEKACVCSMHPKLKVIHPEEVGPPPGA